MVSCLPIQAALDPNDTYWDDQWDMKTMDVNDAWELDNLIPVGGEKKFTNTGSNSITVAVCDSGLNWHPTDANKLVYLGNE